MPGDGIGPEITDSVINILKPLNLPIEYLPHKIHSQAVTPDGDLISPETISEIKKHGFGLKGPFATPIGKGHRSHSYTLTYAPVSQFQALKA